MTAPVFVTVLAVGHISDRVLDQASEMIRRQSDGASLEVLSSPERFLLAAGFTARSTSVMTGTVFGAKTVLYLDDGDEWYIAEDMDALFSLVSQP